MTQVFTGGLIFFRLFVERGEFDRTGQWIGMGLMEACLQADTIQAGDGSMIVLLSQQINFLRYPRFLCEE